MINIHHEFVLHFSLVKGILSVYRWGDVFRRVGG